MKKRINHKQQKVNIEIKKVGCDKNDMKIGKKGTISPNSLLFMLSQLLHSDENKTKLKV